MGVYLGVGISLRGIDARIRYLESLLCTLSDLFRTLYCIKHLI